VPFEGPGPPATKQGAVGGSNVSGTAAATVCTLLEYYVHTYSSTLLCALRTMYVCMYMHHGLINSLINSLISGLVNGLMIP
jgi:hypothetical protein